MMTDKKTSNDEIPQILELPKTAKVDLTGEVFDRLTVIGYVGKAGKKYLWLCLCTCGGYKSVRTSDLTGGKVHSCGCLWLESNRSSENKHRTHGMEGTKFYKCWIGMKERCDNPNHSAYPDYGGRGISYDPIWKSFENFNMDMGEGYQDNLTIDRINNDLGYFKGNCRWVTMRQQSYNRRSTLLVEYLGEEICLKELYDRLQPLVSYARVYQRICRNNWDIERAMFTK